MTEITLENDTRQFEFSLDGFPMVEYPQGLGGSKAKHYLPKTAVAVLNNIDGTLIVRVRAVPCSPSGVPYARRGKDTETLPEGSLIAAEVLLKVQERMLKEEGW